jgi:hypothetical protein
MKRLGRYIFNALAALSLVLCAGTAALWVRGHFVADRAYYSRWRVSGTRAREGAYWVQSGGGVFIIATRQQALGGLADDPASQIRHLALAAPERRWVRMTPDHAMTLAGGPRQGPLGRLGFWHLRAPMQKSAGATSPGNYYAEWAAPAWAVCLVLALLPAARVVRWRRERSRGRAGLCPTCNYDLRATPNRCPECGTIPGRFQAR